MQFHGLIFSARTLFTSRSHGAYRIAHVLREHNWDIEVIDYTYYWPLEKLKELARARITKNTRWIGISLLFSRWDPKLEEFFSWVKSEWPHLVIITGAPAKASIPTTVVDYYTQGYAENAIIELLKYLFSNGPRPRFDIERNNGKPIILSNDQYPTHPISSAMVRYEDRDYIESGEFLSVEFARGCKFSCAFCNYPIIGVKGDYSRDAEDFRMQLMDAYDRFGVTNYFATDETFNDRTEKITKFADVVETLPFVPWFNGTIRVDLLISRPRDREELMRMNFLGHFYGVESFHPEAVKSVGKGMDPERVKQGILDIRHYFENNGRKLYRGHINLIIGLPGESIEHIQSSRAWLEKNWATHALGISPLTIYSNHQAKKSKMSEDYEKYGYTAIDPGAVVGDMKVSDQLEDSVAWRNQHMDIFQAQAITKEWTDYIKSPESIHRLDPAEHLLNPILADLPIEKRLELSLYDLYCRKRTHYGFIDRYIEKKLNYK
jgi:radical SAM superfamily enzyme YgiQ (UPF0313 family)